MANIDRRSWKSRYRAFLNPKPKKPRKPRKKRLPRPVKAKYPSFEHRNDSSISTSRSINGVTGATISQNTYTSTYEVYHREVNSALTPGFREKKRKQLPDNGYWKNQRHSSGKPYYSYFLNTFSGFASEVTHGSSLVVDTFQPNAYRNQFSTDFDARVAARARLADSVNKMSINLGVAFAERKQTANLIANTAYRIAHAARALRKGHLGDAYGLLGLNYIPTQRELDRLIRTHPDKRVSQHWLELQFGWNPLLNDITGAAEQLAKSISGSLYHTVAYGSATKRQTILFKNNFVSGPWPFNGWGYSKTRYRYVLRYRMDNYARAALGSTGISNPLTVAWEILPYSFVVDWFIPVGSYLSRLHSFDGFEFVSGTQSNIWNAEVYKSFARKVTSGQSIGEVKGDAKFYEFDYRRNNLTDFPGSTFPRFRNPLERGPLWKFFTSYALMRQAFGKT